MDVTSPFWVDVGDPYPFDPDRARRLLAEAGHASGLTLDLALPQPFQPHIEAGQLVQAMLARVGVTARPRVVEFGFWLSRIFGGGEYDLTIIGHTGKLDPEGRLVGWGDPARNYIRYENQKVADLIHAGRITATPELRRRIYAEALKMLERLRRIQPDFKRLTHYMQTAREKLADQHHLAGIRHFKEQKLKEAIEEWDQALALNPKLENARRSKERARGLLKSLQEIK
jgi:tetratricopeptide (TPR) repeat protein